MNRSRFVTCCFAGLVSFLLTSCFSLMKADHMVYAGSLGKKVDAALIDSIQKIEINSEQK